TVIQRLREAIRRERQRGAFPGLSVRVQVEGDTDSAIAAVEQALAAPDLGECEKYAGVVQEGLDYAKRHGLYAEHPDLMTAEYGLLKLRRIVAHLKKELAAKDAEIAELRKRPTLEEAAA